MVFNVVPTALEVSLVAGILAWKCGPALAALTGSTLLLYIAFTFTVTQVLNTPKQNIVAVRFEPVTCGSGGPRWLYLAHIAFSVTGTLEHAFEGSGAAV